jgi:NADPH-dependent 2,4-dienoyl-CoA reductase/sulfur reductase-like enzyme
VTGRERLPFAKKFGDEVAQAILGLHESKGTRFRLGVEIVSVRPDGVIVRDGQRDELIAADLVVMGTGIEPELGFAHDLPLAGEGGGIATDASLRVAEGVWVAGDIANVDDTRIEHWRLAEQHGRLAALAMLAPHAGATPKYDDVSFFWTTHYGKRFGYLGHAGQWDEVVTDGDVAGLEFLAFYVKAGKVKAVLGCGRDTEMAGLAELMRNPPTLAAARAAIA